MGNFTATTILKNLGVEAKNAGTAYRQTMARIQRMDSFIFTY
jgi:hypothetical protein